MDFREAGEWSEGDEGSEAGARASVVYRVAYTHGRPIVNDKSFFDRIEVDWKLE